MLVSVEVVINVCWLVLRPPSTKTLCYPTTDYQVRICSGLDDYSYIVGLIYPLILVVFCTIYAIKTRKVSHVVGRRSTLSNRAGINIASVMLQPVPSQPHPTCCLLLSCLEHTY